MANRIIPMLFLALASLGAASAQTIVIDDVRADAFPVMSARVVAVDALGGALDATTLRTAIVEEDGAGVALESAACASGERVLLSSVIAVDVSRSRITPDLRNERRVAQAWVSMLQPGERCALATFAERGRVAADLTDDRPRLAAAIDALRAESFGTWGGRGLVDEPAGAVAIARRGDPRRVVLVVTDGSVRDDEDAVVGAAASAGVTIVAVTTTRWVDPRLERICARTGGIALAGAVDDRSTVALVTRARAAAEGRPPCTITWRSEPGCADVRLVRVGLDARTWDTLSVAMPPGARRTLSAAPLAVGFGPVAPGLTRDTTIELVAGPWPVTISSVDPLPPELAIDPPLGLPRTLAPGERLAVRVRYAPFDSSYTFALLRLAGTACEAAVIPMSGGFPGHAPARRTLRVVRPNGGERYAAGETLSIDWSGVLPDETVRIEFSTDAGATWSEIAEAATGTSLAWRTPDVRSEQCLIRVSQNGRAGREARARAVVERIGEDVPAVFFTGDDARVIALGTPSSLTTIDAASGTVIDARAAVDVRGLHADLSPDDRRIVTPTVRTATVLDVASGSTAGVLTGHDDAVASAVFSTDGARMITAAADGSIRVWDDLARPLRRYEFAGERAIVARQDRAGARLVVASSDPLGAQGTIRVIDTASGAVLARWSAHVANDVAFSPDGRLVASAGADRVVQVWDATSGALVRTLTGHTDVVRALAFSPDGATLASASFDMTLRLWSVDDGRSIQRLAGHRSVVFDVVYSHDGTSLASGGGDGAVILWRLAPERLQTDSSDAVFAIDRAELAVSPIDMGSVELGTARESEFPAALCNRGPVTVTITSLRPEGAAMEDFDVDAGRLPVVLAPGECLPLEVRFAPGALGSRDALVVVGSSVGERLVAMSGIGVSRRLDGAVRAIDFEQVRLDAVRDTVVEFAVVNATDGAMRVEVMEGGPDVAQFDVVEGIGAALLAPGERRSLTIRFAPVREGRASGSVVVTGEGIAPLVIELFGEGICGGNDLALALPGIIDAAPGDVLEVPITLESVVTPGAVRGLRLGLAFNPTVLMPVAVVIGDTIPRRLRLSDTALGIERNGQRHLEVLLDTLPAASLSGGSAVIALVVFRVALGNADSTVVGAEWHGASGPCAVMLRLAPMTVRVRVCRETDSARLFLSTEPLLLRPPAPNPASGVATFEITTIEKGGFSLELIDISGERHQLHDGRGAAAGRYRITSDLSRLPSGRYHCVLWTPTSLRTQPFIITH